MSYLDAGHGHINLPEGQQTSLEIRADGEQFALGRLPPEHGAGPSEGNRELLQPQLPCRLVSRVQLGALSPVVHRVVVLQDEAEVGLEVVLVFLWVDLDSTTPQSACREQREDCVSDLVRVPNKINIVAGNKKCLGILLLQVEIHLVPPHAVHVELLVAVVGQ